MGASRRIASIPVPEEETDYSKRMARLRALYPQASNSQLRGHPRKNEKPLKQMKKREVHKRSWSFLTPSEKETRERSLKVLSLMRRRDYSLAEASGQVGISPEAVIRNTNALKKEGRVWKVKKHDRISRVMRINEDGIEVFIELKDSRPASTIGRYQSAVREYLHTGDESVLAPFEGKRIRDAEGNWHYLETDLDTLYEISEAREGEETYDIYRN